jgi:glycosyltransferase involved in cell wall biosynthesis
MAPRINQPFITIITVVFNAEKSIERTIHSVITQDYNQIEYIIIDGASTDDTVPIIKKYADKISYWISETDNGIYDAMNKGIDAAKGDWIYFLGAGDVMLNVTAKVTQYLKDHNTVYYGDVYRLDYLSLYDGHFSPFRLAIRNICHQAIFYPAAAVRKYKFNTKYRVQADHNLNMQLYGDKQFRLKYIPVIVCNYEGAGISEANWDKPFFRDKMNIIRKNFSFIVYLYAQVRRLIAKKIKKIDYTA